MRVNKANMTASKVTMIRNKTDVVRDKTPQPVERQIVSEYAKLLVVCIVLPSNFWAKQLIIVLTVRMRAISDITKTYHYNRRQLDLEPH